MSSAKCLFSWFLSLGSSTFKAIACTVSTIVLAAVMIAWVLCIWKSNKNEKTMREFIVKSYCWSLPSLTVRIARLTLPFITETIRRFCSSSVKWLSACLSVPKSDTKPPLNLGERKLHRNLSQENCNCARQKKNILQRQSHTLLQSTSCVIVYDDVPYFHVNLNFLKFKKQLKLYRYCINI